MSENQAMAAHEQGQASIQLHIEELVLHHFAPGDRAAIAAALQAELARLLRVEGIPPNLAQWDGRARLNGGEFRIAHDAGAERVGTQLAAALYQSLAGTDGVRPAHGGRKP